MPEENNTTNNHISSKGYRIEISVLVIGLLVGYLISPLLSSDRDTALLILDFLRQLPTDERFHLLAAVSLILIVLWHRLQRKQLQIELNSSKNIFKQNIYEIKHRALILRTGAFAFLGSVFALLAGGFYFMIFLLPQIEVLDASLAQQRQQFLDFKSKFGENLELIVEGLYWFRTENFPLKNQEQIALLNFHADGMHGVIISVEGVAFTTEDGGNNWKNSQGLELPSGDWIEIARFSTNLKDGVVISESGVAFTTEDGGNNWKNSQGLELPPGDWIEIARFSADLMDGVVISGSGMAFTTTNGGISWKKSPDLKLPSGDRIDFIWFNADDMQGVVFSADGEAFTTANGGISWKKSPDLKLPSGDRIVNAGRNFNSIYERIISNKGNVLTATNDGIKWVESQDLKLPSGDRIEIARFNTDGMHGVVISTDGRAYTTETGGEKWKMSQDLNLPLEDRIDDSWFSADGMQGVVISEYGVVFTTIDGGIEWIKSQGLELLSEDWIEFARFSTKLMCGVIVSNNGTIFMTLDDWVNWKTTETNELLGTKIDQLAIRQYKEYCVVVAVDKKEQIYQLNRHQDLGEWESSSMSTIRMKLKDDEDRNNSKIFEEISNGLLDIVASGGSITDKPNNSGQPSDKKENKLLDDLTIIRSVTFAILLFLAQLLIRFAQYNLRLASFWESRSLALQISSIENNLDTNFADLVSAIAPDNYDFKPMSRPQLDQWLQRQKK